MAAPTVPAFQNTSPVAGFQKINATSATQLHPEGTIIRGIDTGPTVGGYGEGEFIYLKGVALTVAGDLVSYDTNLHTTTRVLDDTGDFGPVAVAMSANVASQWGWYQINGSGVVNSTGTGAVGQAYISGTAGQITSSVTADDAILGMKITTAVSGGQVIVQMSRPTLGAAD